MNNKNYQTLLQLILVFLIIINTSTQTIDCSKVSSTYCGTGLCSNYQYLNGNCVLQSQTCTLTQAFQNSTNKCLDCLSLASGSCTSSCSNFAFFSNFQSNYLQQGSTLNGCSNCQDAFGLGCVSCDQSACLKCQSQMSVNTSTNNCRGNLCSQLQNCIVCGSATTCKLCLQGFDLDLTNLNCVSATCKIKYCVKCESTLCSACYEGYKLSSNKDRCQPSCTDINCNNCIKPGVCGGCSSGYILNSLTSRCFLDCSSNTVSNCYTCSHLNICNTCIQGYHIAFKGTKCFSDCSVANCIFCQPLDTCILCQTGYKLNGRLCVIDNCNIDYCNNCNDLITCKTCATNFTLSSNNATCNPACLNTIPNCLICSGQTVCQSCDVGYRLTAGTNITRRCEKICSIGNCKVCGSSSTCLECQANYALSIDLLTCKLQCISNCDLCKTSTQCQTCISGFNLIDKSCILACPLGQILVGSVCSSCSSSDANCLTCRQSGGSLLCLSCKDGYFLNTLNKCTECSKQMTNCLRCSGTISVICEQCQAPTRLTSGQCISCSLPNCEGCQISDNTKCANCSAGFQINSSGQCSLKSITCPSTTILINGQCKCSSGAYLLGGRCISCSSNCINCTASACSRCASGYFPSASNCLQCSKNCLSCTSTSNCLQCTSDKSLINGICESTGGQKAIVKNDVYISCGTGCKSCTLDANNNIVCTLGQNGYALVNGVAIKCHTSCKSCSTGNPENCRSCFDGTALEGQKCKKCKDENALTCASTNIEFSLTCQRGYSTKSTPGKCTKCGNKCLKCDIADTGKCDPNSCDSGYTLDQTQKCVNCFNNCPFCDVNDPRKCLRCDSNRFLVNQACSKCPNNCQKCVSLTNCTQCDPGYVIVVRPNSSILCYAAPQFPCVRYDTNLQCQKCFAGYSFINETKVCQFNATCKQTKTCTECSKDEFLSNGDCIACIFPEGCTRCTSNNAKSCTKCVTGYYLDGGVCYRCTIGCKKCYNADYCSQADGGYYLQVNHDRTISGISKPCNSPCGTCQNFAYYCLTCIEGYTINGATCFSNRAVVVAVVYTPKSLYDQSDDKQTKLKKAFRNLYSIKKDICSSLPNDIKVGDDQICSRSLLIQNISINSLQVDFKVDSNNKGTTSQASTSIIESITSNGIGSQPVNVVSSSTQGYSGAQSTLNLGLILGVSIPLGILFILIVVVVYYSRKSQDYQQEQQFDKDAYESGTQIEDII